MNSANNSSTEKPSGKGFLIGAGALFIVAGATSSSLWVTGFGGGEVPYEFMGKCLAAGVVALSTAGSAAAAIGLSRMRAAMKLPVNQIEAAISALKEGDASAQSAANQLGQIEALVADLQANLFIVKREGSEATVVSQDEYEAMKRLIRDQDSSFAITKGAAFEYEKGILVAKLVKLVDELGGQADRATFTFTDIKGAQEPLTVSIDDILHRERAVKMTSL
ncbi:hypothetical protein ACFOY8_13930 [Thalassospira xianhensis]|uniref:Uncharacterized protein n=1 Tax=Thalassospira xianhensis MCCC 1A02616 TaxID=1177929 RepID=A0A367UHQ2_9PROT|nr:hypothetical protein [Thalassospira xianhensis]RCK07738.1 hypothetical protein TH5_01345 [Thalassospira xianhensis MCCC 1A02616]